MDPNRWKQVDSLLQAALERPPGERDHFLREACAGDAPLEREVRSLLDSQQEAGSFLEAPAIEVAARAIAAERATETSDGGLAGKTFSHYRVLEKLGAGGMGVVWKARDARLNRFVALKFLPAAMVSDAERKQRFAQEARAASALNHANIVTIYDIGHDGADFIAMEFVAGRTLTDLIPRKGLRLAEVLNYAIQIADALAAAHTAGIVHRDLKPGNIMVDENGAAKVLDFGLAKLTPRDSGSGLTTDGPPTSGGVLVGTVSYMSPEQAEGKKLDSRTDIFSFGAVLYEMITGRRAFGGDSLASILSAILRDEPKPAADIVDVFPRELDRIVRRCLQKDPNRRYHHAADLKIDLQQVEELLASGSTDVGRTRGPRQSMLWWWIAGTAACAAVALGIGWRLHSLASTPPRLEITRITNDEGFSADVAISRDGKLAAYSSNRDSAGQWDIYVKQVAGGQPIRLTSDGSNLEPDFSPDGSRIAFRSSRNGGGIFEMPAFGGEARMLAKDGRNPKYSPDGSQVAYWIGSPAVANAVPGSGTVWVVQLNGGQPHRIGLQFTASRDPIWSPDGKHLLLTGYTSSKTYDGSSIDWYLAPTDGGKAIKTGLYDALVRAELRAREIAPVVGAIQPSVPSAACWSPADNTVAFSVTSGNAANIWEVAVSPRTGKLEGPLRRLTVGVGPESYPSCKAGGTRLFTNWDTRTSVWSLPMDLNRATVKGPIERVTDGPAQRHHASLSRDGKLLASGSDRLGQFNIWIRDLTAGRESILSSSPLYQRFPTLSPSGTRTAFSVYEKDNRAIYVAGQGSQPEKMCDACLRATDWSRDEKSLLVFGSSPYQVSLIDIESRHETLLAKHASYDLLYARFSPDNRWISFTVRVSPNRARIVIAPLHGTTPIPESAWIPIADVRSDDWANWSPDGRTLYFTAFRDSHPCLWARRIDAASHQPVGDVFAVHHFHGRQVYNQGGWSAAGERIAVVLQETTGNIWMMSQK